MTEYLEGETGHQPIRGSATKIGEKFRGLRSSRIDDPMQRLDAWLSGFPSRDGIVAISEPRAFAISEAEYEVDIGSGTGASAGVGAHRLWRFLAPGVGGTALEIGAGSGAITFGFVSAAEGTATLVTDPSSAFLAITERKLKTIGKSRCLRYATLVGEDLHRLPSEQFDLVLLQAALHHISDWKPFLQEVARVLIPGGVLLFQEPFSEGYLMMGMAARLLLEVEQLDNDDRIRLENLCQSIFLLSDRTIDKSHGEDKHCFFTDEMVLTCRAIFSDVYFLRNQSFDSISNLGDIAAALSTEYMSASFLEYCRSFFSQHHKVSPKGLALFDERVAPAFADIERLFGHGDGPALFSVVACRKSDLKQWERELRDVLMKARRQFHRIPMAGAGRGP
jgi:SAM-dependent methyltransferase